MKPIFEVGERVRFSDTGRAKIRGMPEAWGLHTADRRGEVGEVIDVDPAEDDVPAQVSVEFPSGGAYHWDADCFEAIDTPPQGPGGHAAHGA